MSNQPTIIYPKSGDVFLVNFEPTIGVEIKKTRPALILQNDVSNQYSQSFNNCSCYYMEQVNQEIQISLDLIKLE